jgi:putative endonuclease
MRDNAARANVQTCVPLTGLMRFLHSYPVNSCNAHRCPRINNYTMPPPAPRRRPASIRWLIYLLRCSDNSLYTGITNDLPKRLKAHATGKASRYTRSRLPVTLVYSEPHRSKSAALKQEAAIKKLSRPQKDRLVAVKPTRRSRPTVSLTATSANPEAP